MGGTRCLVVLISFALQLLSNGCCLQTACERPTTKEVLHTCHNLFSVYKLSLIKVQRNLYNLGRFFFYSPNADPVLLRVNYNVIYDDNITLEELALCPRDNEIDDEYLTSTNRTIVTYGWTSNGVYSTVHPFLLNVLQFQFPFAFLRAIKSTVFKSHVQDPFWNALLWNSNEDLSSVTLDLEVNALPCKPTEGQIDVTLHHITQQLQVFAAGHGLESTTQYFSSVEAKNLIGFALNQTSIMPSALLKSNNDMLLFGTVVLFCNVFSVFSMWGAVTITRPLRQDFSVYMASHVGLISAVVMIEVGVVVSFITELIMTAIWTDKNSGSDIYLCLWIRLTFMAILLMGPLLIFIVKCIATKTLLPHQVLALLLSQAVYILTIFSIPTFLYLLVFPTVVITIFLHFACVSLSMSVVIALGQVLMQENQDQNTSSGTSDTCSQCLNKWMLDPKINTLPLLYITVFSMILIFPMAFGSASVTVLDSIPVVPLFYCVLFLVLLWIVMKLKISNNISVNNDAVNRINHGNFVNQCTDANNPTQQSNLSLVSTNDGANSQNTNHASNREQMRDLVEQQTEWESNELYTTFGTDEGAPLLEHRHRYNGGERRGYGFEHTTNFDSEDNELFQSCSSAQENN